MSNKQNDHYNETMAEHSCADCRVGLNGSFITVGGKILCNACDQKRMLATGRVHLCSKCNERMCPIEYATCLHCKGYGRATLDSLKKLEDQSRPTPDNVPVVAV